MKPPRIAIPRDKAPTGITGFDEMTGDGLPRGRTTMLSGGPGSGKTVHLNYLVQAGERNRGMAITKSRGTRIRIKCGN